MKKTNIILIILLVLFTLITIVVMNNNILVFDNDIYNFIISFKSDKLTSFFRFITNFGDTVIILIVTLLFLIIEKDKVRFYPLIVSIDIGILNLILKIIFKRDRPNILQLVTVDNYSYPSGHSMIAMGLYGCFIYLIYKYVKNKKIKISSIILLSILILLIGLSRVYLGVHHFSDVLGGFIISICYLIIFDKVINWGNKNEKINSK